MNENEIVRATVKQEEDEALVRPDLGEKSLRSRRHLMRQNSNLSLDTNEWLNAQQMF